MNQFDLKNPRNAYALLISLIVLAGAYIFYDHYWVSYTEEKDRLEQELTQLKNELDRIYIQQKRKAQLEVELKNAEKEFTRLREMFPEEEKVPLRLQDLYAVVRASGVQITKFNPEGRAEKEYFVENNYSLAINAGYHMLGYLFAEIANFSYPTSISNLKVGRYGGIEAELQKAMNHGWIPITVSVSFNLTTYTSRNMGQ